MARDRTRATLDAGGRLTLSGVKLKPRTSSQITWRMNGLKVFGLLCLEDSTGFLSLTFAGKQQRIGLVAVPRPYGGVQWYLLCPATYRRVSVLWKPPGASQFASRQAWGRRVTYYSQSIDPIGRAWRVKRKVAKRLGSEDPNDHELPDKPPGMWWSTYDRHVARYEAADERLNDGLAGAMAAFMLRYG